MSPNGFAIVLILFSALTHALASTLMKRSDNKYVFRGLIGLVCVVVTAPLIFFFPVPPTTVWPVLALSLVLHWGYHFLWATSFTRSDMSLAYPIMRGSAPAFVAVFAWLILKETLAPLEALGLAIALAALMAFSWPAKGAARQNLGAIGLALFTGVMIALYTLVDAIGVRLSPSKISFIIWFFFLEGVGVILIMGSLQNRDLIRKAKADLRGGVTAGVLSLGTYGSALYALSLAQTAHMSALRETSVVFGAVFAALWLKEDFGSKRICLAICLAFGLVLMQMA